MFEKGLCQKEFKQMLCYLKQMCITPNVVFFYCIYFSFSNGLMLSREHSALEDELCYNLKE